MLPKTEQRRARELTCSILDTLGRIESHLESLAQTLKASQQSEDSASSDKSAEQKSTHPRPVLTLHTITELGNTEARKRNADRESDKAFQKQSLVVQWLLFTATLLAFGAAAYYAYIAKIQRDIMSRTLDTQERAYLSIGAPHQREIGPDSIIRVPINNYGHVSSVDPIFKITYMRWDEKRLNARSYLDTRSYTVKRDRVIAPGPSGFELFITPPALSDFDKYSVELGHQREMMIVTIQYDTGFNYTDAFEFCIAYGFAEKEWIDCGKRIADVDLTKEKSQKGE